MNLLHLQYFYVVAQEQGFTNASKRLRIQQPAISRMVALLEEDFGFKLFERSGRSIRLTERGREVFEHCRNIFGNVEALKQSLGKISGVAKGPFLIAASEPVASHFLPKQIATLLTIHPLVYPQIFSGPAAMLFEQIVKGDIEIGIFFHIPELPKELEIWKTEPIRFHIVVRSDLKKKPAVLESFIGSREIDDSSTRRFPTVERLKRLRPQTKIMISSNNLTSHRELVLQGLGVAVLPRFLVEDDLKTGQLTDLFPREETHFQMKYIKRCRAPLSPAATAISSSNIGSFKIRTKG